MKQILRIFPTLLAAATLAGAQEEFSSVSRETAATPVTALPSRASSVDLSAEVNAAFSQRLAEYRENHPKSGLLTLAARVFRSKDSPPRTLVRYWPEGGRKDITFWSSADFALIAGGDQLIHRFRR